MLHPAPGEVVAQPRAAPALHVVCDQVETGHDDQDYRSGEQQAEAQADRHRRQEGRLAGSEEDQRRDAQEGRDAGQQSFFSSAAFEAQQTGSGRHVDLVCQRLSAEMSSELQHGFDHGSVARPASLRTESCERKRSQPSGGAASGVFVSVYTYLTGVNQSPSKSLLPVGHT